MMNPSANKTSNTTAKNGKGESYRWKTLPSIGTTVKGCHLVPMKAPVSMRENDISIEEGGLTIRKVKEALPGVVKVVSLRRPEWNGPMTGPKMYTREEVAEEGLLWGQVHCRPMGHADSEPFPSEETVHQFFKEVEVDDGLVAVHCSHGLHRTGYLICRYLIQKCGVEPREAVTRFNEARGFPMKRQTLIDHLFSRGWETQEHAGKRKEVDERPGSSLTEKWGQLKNITEEFVDDMSEIRQEER